MRLPIYQIDAFTQQLFSGNPAAVVPLPRWLPDTVLQAIAAENNLAETAFVVPQGMDYLLRWFTPETEVRLCGHATLAAASALFRHRHPDRQVLRFSTLSGWLTVSQEGERLSLDSPILPAEPVATPPALSAALGEPPLEVLLARDYLAVYRDEATVRALMPDMSRLRFPEALGVIVTAPGGDCDFVSRFFAPGAGIPEDPVTGSAHCTLVPYWAERLGRADLCARQVSWRGGELQCRLDGDRVHLGGHAVHYLDGWIEIPDSLLQGERLGGA